MLPNEMNCLLTFRQILTSQHHNLTFVFCLDRFIEIGNRQLPLQSFIYPNQVRSGLKTWFEEVWDVERNNRRLCFYNKVKESFGTELYLTLNLRYWESKRIAQFRTSSHRYNIETGRYGEKRNDVIHRVCNTCSHINDDAVSLLAKLP